jgi:drug/metabolite transporter (DMT)-like permease
MPLGTAVTLRYLSPFFAVALASFFLGERVRAIQWLFLLGAFGGVILIKGFDASLSTLGLVVILSSAVLSGGVYFVIRKIADTEESIVIVHYFIALATLVGAVSCFFAWVTPVGHEWLLLGGFGILGYAAQYTMTQALQTTASHIITPFKYMEVVFTLLAGWLVYAETYTLPVMVGIVLIMLCLWGNVQVARSTK